jgi:hypothetical protein
MKLFKCIREEPALVNIRTKLSFYIFLDNFAFILTRTDFSSIH